MNVGEIYIFLYQQLESGKRLYYNSLTYFLFLKKFRIKIKANLFKYVKQYAVIKNHLKVGVIALLTEK